MTASVDRSHRVRPPRRRSSGRRPSPRRTRWTLVIAAIVVVALALTPTGRGILGDVIDELLAGAEPGAEEGAWIDAEPSTIDRDLLADVPVADPASAPDYDRAAFGPAWADVDRNGCDTRNDILARDLEDVTFREADGPCIVETGTLVDPYTGERIAFDRDRGSGQIDIDHVVALEDAWGKGAHAWSDAQRREFANDPAVLAAVGSRPNRSKGSQTLGQWQPEGEAARCRYGAQYLLILDDYDLSASREDVQELERLADVCG